MPEYSLFIRENYFFAKVVALLLPLLLWCSLAEARLPEYVRGITLDGVNDYLICDDSGGSCGGRVAPTDGLTIQAWVRLSDYVKQNHKDATIFAKKDIFRLGIKGEDGEPVLAFYYQDSNSKNHSFDSAESTRLRLYPNNWFHVALTFQHVVENSQHQATVKMYIDGKEVFTQTVDGARGIKNKNTKDLLVGRKSASAATSFPGSIDDLVIQDAVSVIDMPISGKPDFYLPSFPHDPRAGDNMVALYGFDEQSGDVLNMMGGGGNLTLVNGATRSNSDLGIQDVIGLYLVDNCDYRVLPGTDEINGRTPTVSTRNGDGNALDTKPFDYLSPQDVVCLTGDQRGSLRILNINENVSTTPTRSTVLKNYRQQLRFSSPGSETLLMIMNSRYLKISGSGADGQMYGIHFDGNGGQNNAALDFNTASSDIEIEKVKVTDMARAGFRAGTKAHSRNASDVDYDLNGDGIVDSSGADSADRICHSTWVCANQFIMSNILIHDNWLERANEELMYIGKNRSLYTTNSSGGIGRGQGKEAELNCTDSNYPPLEDLEDPCFLNATQNTTIKGIYVYNNVVIDAGRDAINLKGVRGDCAVYNNVVIRDGQVEDLWNAPSQSGGINLQFAEGCDVYGNWIHHGNGPGIHSDSLSANADNRFYNNIIFMPGQSQAFDETSAWGAGLKIGSGDRFQVWSESLGGYESVIPAHSNHVIHNTVVNSKSYGVVFNYLFGSSRIENNIVVGYDSGQWLDASSSAIYTETSNFKHTDPTEVHFANYYANANDPKAVDLQLTTSSIVAVDQGTNSSIDHDHFGNVRPLDGDQDGSAVSDIGAHELAP